ncbi:LOW QUALITY PROTEIN: hypothetical protein BRADI_2g62078v3 [Brachypodium distachyon]|uniref:Uncharacterized protein n=1 Tax=Brachypodium distachyon TaxID=15368 RepID=A0A2K2DHB6_BRADI|nr:LOW QUALITY PROTEIN: hypothetical protein BRADI_2g62078v3 [Brachypodium distachyon]
MAGRRGEAVQGVLLVPAAPGPPRGDYHDIEAGAAAAAEVGVGEDGAGAPGFVAGGVEVAAGEGGELAAGAGDEVADGEADGEGGAVPPRRRAAIGEEAHEEEAMAGGCERRRAGEEPRGDGGDEGADLAAAAAGAYGDPGIGTNTLAPWSRSRSMMKKPAKEFFGQRRRRKEGSATRRLQRLQAVAQRKRSAAESRRARMSRSRSSGSTESAMAAGRKLLS